MDLLYQLGCTSNAMRIVQELMHARLKLEAEVRIKTDWS